ncbi:uncharacterized protein BX664DRAFT_260652 [Halteromyces radiatus]|uniref:uncharacterized protein n=1 Tax=Halteromyces radiatus TaxID=101107 RepID=UPI00221EB810|nr:uncharacterized protein BX664DRAFT_260652 [Halteromyces radiatus]KAI8093895.1 hypothetical protein BX664DRAFT_260652 [Halteromyces radiatus]
MPLHVIAGQCLSRFGSLLKTSIRALLVLTVWLILLPYVTLWIWRLYFWSSESIGSSFDKSNNTPLFNYSISEFLADCFEGQIITLLIITVVVAGYLFREWVIQNTPVETNQDVELEQDLTNTTYQQESITIDNSSLSPLARQQMAVDALLNALDDMDDHEQPIPRSSIDIKNKLEGIQLDLHQKRNDTESPSSTYNKLEHVISDNDDTRSRSSVSTPSSSITQIEQIPTQQRYTSNQANRMMEPSEIVDMNNDNDDDDDDEDDLFIEDDIDGVLEAIGMRGNPWLLLQNSVLVCVMICLCLGIAVWIPYIIGRLIILVHPISFVRTIGHVLQYVTDPIMDYILDRYLTTTTTTTSSSSRLTTLFELFSGNILGQPFFTHALNACTTLTWQQHKMDMEFWKLSTHKLVYFLGRITQRWHQFAEGHTGLDRSVCTLVGYSVLFLICFWYLTCYRQQSNTKTYIQQSIDELIRQQGIFFKVFSFVALELVVLPLICGILLDLATLPLIANASISTRWTFAIMHPYSSSFLHWLVGTGFMFHFAMFVTLCREIVRPGVLWFIRDPNDPQFHPVQEIMQRPFLLLLRKICTGALIYLALIVIGIGTVTWGVSQYAGIYPLRWPFDEPLSTLAIDILAAQFLIPLLVAYIKPRAFCKQVLTLWWHAASCRLRLSSFMFGGRYPEEEGCFIRPTWKSWLLRETCSRQHDDDVIIDNKMKVVSFQSDGQLVRVPKRDSVMVRPERRMMVPVDPITLEPLDPMEKHLGHPAADEDNGGEEHNTTIVYIPPHFEIRVILFLFSMWFSGSVMTCSITVAPLLLGRSIFETYLFGGKQVHDLYAFVIGAYVMVLLSISINWLARGLDYCLNRHIHGGWMVLLTRFLKHGCKMVYLTLMIGWVIPLFVGVAIDLYVFMPIRYSSSNHTLVLHLAEDWSYGILYLGIIHGVIYLLPTNQWQRILDQYISDGLTLLNIDHLTRTIFGPLLLGIILSMMIPGGLAWMMIQLLGKIITII